MDSPCDTKDLLKGQLTTINTHQQNGHRLFNGYQQDDIIVKEELSVSESAIDIHGNASHIPGDLHRSNAEEYTQLQYDLNSGQTTIKPEHLSDQSHPCISELHDKASDGTAFEGEATMCKPTHAGERPHGYQQDDTTVKEELSVSKSAIDIHRNASQTTIKPEPLSDQSHPCISELHDKVSDGTAFEGEATICKPTHDGERPHGYQQDDTTVKEELSVSKSAIDIHRNASQTTIKPEPLSDQSHPCISALHDKASDGTAFEREATMCKPTHDGERPHACPQCKKGFTSNNYLKKHMMIHTGEKPHSCLQCDKRFAGTSHLKRHMMIHTGERPHSCPLCNKGFSNTSNLRRHMLTHTGEKPQSCPQCHKGFISTNKLKHHMMIHTGERPHSCRQCNKGFINTNNLKRHMMIHTGERPHSCPECYTCFTQGGDLKKHMMIHTGEKPHSCPLYKKGFTNTGNLRKHLMTHAKERQNSCPQCHKGFNSTGRLKRHMIIHTGEKPHLCSQCSKSFTRPYELRKHMMIHTGERPHLCSQCSKGFIYSADLKKHMMIHTGEKPHLLAPISLRTI